MGNMRKTGIEKGGSPFKEIQFSWGREPDHVGLEGRGREFGSFSKGMGYYLKVLSSK